MLIQIHFLLYTITILPPGEKFFYIDFSNPNILVKMAQFYYDFATKDVFITDKKMVTYSYISKITHVIASSLYTCDVMCEMTNVTYSLTNPLVTEEVITYDSDRRFYFSCNSSNTAPDYWENPSDPNYKLLDDYYDQAVFNLDYYINSYAFVNLDEYTAEYIVTAYEVSLRAYERYNKANTIPPRNMNELQDIFDFKKNFIIAHFNFKNILDNLRITSRSAEEQRKLDVYRLTHLSTIDHLKYGHKQVPNGAGGLKWVLSDGSPINASTRMIINDAEHNIRCDKIIYYCDKVIETKRALWTYQQTLQPILADWSHPQYTLRGCTHVDGTAGSVADPDVTAYDEDKRKEVNFDVTPYLKRCQNIYMTTNQCIDLSNVELIVDKYKELYPNKRIKTIHSIKSQGRNVCQFVWDENIIGTPNITRVRNNILYQQDLSSCGFFLPSSSNASSGSGNLIGGKSLYGATQSQTIAQPPTSVKRYVKNSMYNNAIVNTTTLPNDTLSLLPAYYNAPSSNSARQPAIQFATNPTETYDEIPRYDILTAQILPKLIRPKRPIRVTYPDPPDSNLGNYSNNFCYNTETIKKFMIDYNTNPANKHKILTVLRAKTTSSNTCDMEVDMLSGASNDRFITTNTLSNRQIQRKTISYKMKEGFQSQRFTYDSLNNVNGLGITQRTDYHTKDSNNGLGMTFQKPYLDSYNPTVISNIKFFNDDLVTTFTSTTKANVTTKNKLLIGIAGSQYLSNSPTCRKQCSDPAIMQRIMEQYNIDNTSKGRYMVTDNNIDTIFAASTEDADTCGLYFSQNQEFYIDKYKLNPKNDSSNYRINRNPAIKMVNMKQLPGCIFVPIPNQKYVDISATDVSLLANYDVDNPPPFVYKVRENCSVNCLNSNLYNSAKNNYQSKSGNTITTLDKIMKVSNDTCDYLITQIMRFPNNPLAAPRNPTTGQLLTSVSNVAGVLRVRYNYPYYDESNIQCGDFRYEATSASDVFDKSFANSNSYKTSNLELQWALNTDQNSINSSPLWFYYTRSPVVQAGLNGIVKNPNDMV